MVESEEDSSSASDDDNKSYVPEKAIVPQTRPKPVLRTRPQAAQPTQNTDEDQADNTPTQKGKGKAPLRDEDDSMDMDSDESAIEIFGSDDGPNRPVEDFDQIESFSQAPSTFVPSTYPEEPSVSQYHQSVGSDTDAVGEIDDTLGPLDVKMVSYRLRPDTKSKDPGR
jgi:hypothetical protein